MDCIIGKFSNGVHYAKIPDTEAKRLFESLSDGNKRGLIYLITSVKATEKRIDRSLKIADQIKAGITSPRKMKF